MLTTILTLLILFVISYLLLRNKKKVVSTTTTTVPIPDPIPGPIPNPTTTIVESEYYGYEVDVYECGVCDDTPIQSNILVQDTHADLLIKRYYSDSITGYVFKIINTGQLIGGQTSNMVGVGRTSCKLVECV